MLRRDAPRLNVLVAIDAHRDIVHTQDRFSATVNAFVGLMGLHDASIYPLYVAERKGMF